MAVLASTGRDTLGSAAAQTELIESVRAKMASGEGDKAFPDGPVRWVATGAGAAVPVR
jgi:hypothetical protein